jgi:hypothetical protein
MIQASQIREHMRVVGSDGQQLGSVAGLEGSAKFKLARTGGGAGHDQFIPLDWVHAVEGQTIRLSKSSHDVQTQFERGGTAHRK